MNKVKYLEKFQKELDVLEDKIEGANAQRKVCTDDASWHELTRLINLLQTKKYQLKKKIENVEQNRSPWGSEIGEQHNPNFE
ncbi:MAG: hypothetical protein EP346_06885 [Bacteroidetes bacterium]|nr:MAG: hypothetical protein EP346_06885 [Bacteroidota bacterium]